MTWEDDYRRGCTFFEQRKYEAALRSFNKAACENKTNASTFYQRSLVLERLNRYRESLRDVQKAIDLMPESESWKAYRHSAALLLKMGRLEESLKMVDIAVERADEDDKKDVILVDLRERIMEALEPRPCHFSKIPVEISTEILALVVDGDYANMLALTLVCRGWRDIVNRSSRFWRHLVLTPKTRLKQADATLERSGGTLTTLHITGGFSFSTRPSMLKRANPDMWSRLETLHITSQSSLRSLSLPPGTVEQLQLVNLKLSMDKLDNVTWMALGKMDKSRLRRLMLRANNSELISSISFFCASLTTLELCLPITARKSLSILKGTPMLESLDLKSDATEYFNLGQVDPIELAHLRDLRLNHYWYSKEYLRYTRVPNVTTLTIIHVRDPLVIPQYITKLEHLHLSHCVLPVSDFITLLRTSTSLRTLEIPRCSFRGADGNVVIEALARPIPTRKKQGASQMICCPQLQTVNLSGLSCLRTNSVVLLVKAHIHGVVSPHDELELASSSEEPQIKLRRILTLVLDDCLLFDSNALNWLRASVTHFSFKGRPH
ncbi:uncharacterized protein FOMMEDRAFT_153521 [Fomitiporia mediterranea MF3/22]|uniref:uncharacterized protein n=1 Tax=Fomitiporia mediterranea (strain MF3/22) TaxID=694068 RepID=UPI0004409CA5|nr:uncharacterized protein FOMMEDRAFT_153521 [Fomitiporia mediterranea MF3/22]EJD06141.1 hypothetical protein FOMMEDRAFT_153521 [Fomitiporia mediterranea MF3/22]